MVNLEITLEEMIRDSAISIVYGDENYHSPSLMSELAKMNAIVRSLLQNEVNNLIEEQRSGN